MADMSYICFVHVVLCLWAGHVTWACSCIPLSGQDPFCNGNFAAAIYVVSDGVVSRATRTYKIQTLYMYRGQDKGVINYSRLDTPLNSCGVSLQPGKFYIVSGSLRTDGTNRYRMNTILCGFVLSRFDSNPTYTFVPPTCTTPTSLDNSHLEIRTG